MIESIELGSKPEEGMVLVRFSSNEVLKGEDLNQQISYLANEKYIGYKKAVSYFKEHGVTSFEEIKKIINKIINDFKEDKDSQKAYNYIINKFFWTYEENIPKDPRYHKLNYSYCKGSIINIEDKNIKGAKQQ